MKKFLLLLSFILLFFTVSVFAQELELPSTTSYFFAGDGITNIDYDGNTFVGIKANKLVTSTDFQNWYCYEALPDVNAAVYFNHEFIAVGKGITLKSQDGVDWKAYDNNLNAPLNQFAKNSKAMLTSVSEYEYDSNKLITSGTYQSVDGIKWTVVKNIPDGTAIRLINDKFVIESKEYMSGIYVSDDGLRFTRLPVKGFDLVFSDDQYFVIEYIDDLNYIWTSADLVNWEREKSPYTGTYPYNSIVINVNGIDTAYNLNGNSLVYKDGFWEFNHKGVDESWRGHNLFVYYNVSQYGLFAWATNHRSYFLKDFKETMVYDHYKYTFSLIHVRDGKFYVLTQPNYNDAGAAPVFTAFESEDGVNWKERKEISFEDPYAPLLKAANGSLVLESEYNTSRMEIKPEIKGRLTDSGGNTVTVVYEDAKYDCIALQGGNGVFLMQSFMNGVSYYSLDGINRYPGQFGYINGDTMIYFTDNNILHVADTNQLKNIKLDPTVKVKLNDEYLSFSTAPVIENGRTLIPLRFLFERAGATVNWEGGPVTIQYKDTVIQIAEGSDLATVNGVPKKLEAPIKQINKKMMIPLRFISEELGFKVTYDEEKLIVSINSD